MANDEVLGPRKTMFVLVIVVGCFAVLWPRILSPLLIGHSQEQLKPNKFDREAAVKQERSPIRGMGPHPALRERGRAIPPGSAPQVQPKEGRQTLPPHVRVRTSPLSVYYEQVTKVSERCDSVPRFSQPPPIPGMRPPLGSPGGPVPAPKSSMGFVMPIYTICIIVFFVYTLSKILFKRTGSPYESVTPDPEFRRRVFRDDSRSTPDKLGPKERDAIVTAISGLVAEVQQQMEASDAQFQQRQEAQDNARPYTNGTILLNSGPVHIITSEFQEPKQTIPEAQKETAETQSTEITAEGKKEESADLVLDSEERQVSKDLEQTAEQEKTIEEVEQKDLEENNSKDERIDELNNVHAVEESPKKIVETSSDIDLIALTEGSDLGKDNEIVETIEQLIREKRGEDISEKKQSTPELLEEAILDESINDDDNAKDSPSVKVLGMEVTTHAADGGAWPKTQSPLAPPPVQQPQKPAHEAKEVKSIFLETEIPQQARVLVAEFEENRTERPKPAKNAPLVVSGKMTLSLIQDAPRDTPERDPESTVEDFTTASAMTQPNAEKEDDLSDEEIEEEIEIEEIEEEIEEEEEEEEEPISPTKKKE